MSFVNHRCRIAKIGTLLSILITLFLVSDAPGQEQICECVDTYNVAGVRTAPVRSIARRSKAAHRYRSTAARVVPRRSYETIYVPVREVEYVPRYVEYIVNDDCDDGLYRTTNHTYVSERISSNDYNRRKVRRNGYGTRAVDADYYDTRRIASDYGRKDGFYDGYQAGMERDAYHPENSGDYQKATNGYEDDFGDKNVYRQAYRRAYLRGYDAGWRSVAQKSTYRAVRY